MIEEYHSSYDWKILGYVDLALCPIISISNALVILVFAKKKMYPVDVIFTHIAISESLAALTFVPHIWQKFIRTELCSIEKHKTREWEMISMYSIATAFLFRSMATWLAVMLAAWRYMAVLHPLKARVWCNMKTTHIFVIIGYAFSLVIAIPPYFSIDVREIGLLLDQNGCFTKDSSIGKQTTIYTLHFLLYENTFWYTVTMFTYAIFMKIGPSLVVAVVIYKLIAALSEAKKNSQEMSLCSHHYTRTTMILILISLLFVIAEVPHGICVLLSAILGRDFFRKYYYNCFMEIFNCLLLISGSFNFIIYYTMSHQFRRTAKKLFSRTTRDTVPQNARSSYTGKSFRTVNQTSNLME